MEDLKKYIRDIPDFPKEGIIFHDITPLLQNAKAFESAVNEMAKILEGQEIDYLIGIEARGFIFASALALKLGTGLVIVRKPGKLPYVTINASYDLEYGTDSLEVHRDAIHEGSKVVLIDDLLATGGTAAAAGDLIEQLGGEVLGHCFLVELTELQGYKKVEPHSVWSVLKYPV
ncbi:MAG: adenine phosphoribosyltransferase [Thermodesulfobacteriales bacterium]|jgi:adenine phosphoribosyltransferase|nr:MAG: adenine phosphoribosyltransferase [Thermodesulfobacteriales bacterium]